MGARAAAALQHGFRGQLIAPGDPEYDRARAVWNGAIDRHPALIARCSGTADVLLAVEVAREQGLPVAVRGGGHSIAGLALCEGGLVVDLSSMRDVRVDAERRIAHAQPGVTWGGLDQETQRCALATPGAPISSTGIAGFTLGGGFGWLSRAYGLACDNLLEAELVTADGRVVTASAARNPELFWGIRGGGGNFGIATSFSYRLHPVGPQVLCGMLHFAADRAPQVLRAVRGHLRGAPDGLSVTCLLGTAPADPSLPTEVHGTRVISVAMCYAGRPERGRGAMAPLRALPGVLADTVQLRPYTVWQQALDRGRGPGARNYWKAEYLATLNDTAIATLTGDFARITSPLSRIQLVFLGGAIARVGADDTAYTHRAAPYLLAVESRWHQPAEDPVHTAWTGRLWTAMRAYSSGGASVNFLGQEGPGRILEAYGPAKYRRLTALKDVYDPGNLFRVNQNIPPSS
ncbi:FAD-binding oxidoreductase [Kitasatospora sp. GP82]|uniref:FAD-binding oxidoreductase n=1 Tax=Kitasatospora sp. GP82 TaxID=3035089 RepID=UPI002473B528|nr:FAD-binding oxidoreductase [Kitasatospora sp. GP82]MDH6126991.1 FAD/FMN-containing dehydrogenase [Kitasatospora sp. GP82]